MKKLKEEIKAVRDPRRSYGNLMHKLEDIIIIGLCTVICGGEDFNDMEEFGKTRQEFFVENQITLGEINVEEKTNEITAVPELLDLIDVEDSIVTADAMSCQKKITEKIVGKKADYLLGLKQNQPALFKDAEDYFNDFSAELPSVCTTEKGHGRIEKREYRLLNNLSWLEQKDEWCGLNGLGMVHSMIEENGEIHEFTRYFITSLTDVNEFSYAVRKHWSIENQLHWCLDVIFREDASRARKDKSPLNMNILRKTALSLVTQAQYGRISKKKLMFKAALAPSVLLDILFFPKK